MKFKIFILSLGISATPFAQYDVNDVKSDSTKKESNISLYDIRERTFVGGDFSLRFGTQTYVYLAPMVGYDVLPKANLSAGLTSMYQLFRVKYNNGAVVQDHSFGGGVFVRYRPFDFLLAQMELDLYNTTDYTVLFGDRVNVPAFFLGAGYAANLGDRAYYNIMLMYDFVRDPNMPLPQIISGIPVYLRYGFVWYLG